MQKVSVDMFKSGIYMLIILKIKFNYVYMHEYNRFRTLALSTRPAPGVMSAAGPRVPLLRDLNRRYGNPVVHYVAWTSSVRANGSPVGHLRHFQHGGHRDGGGPGTV